MARFFLLIFCALLVACGSPISPSPDAVFRTSAAPAAAAVYVAEACAPGSKSCSGNGFVQQLGGRTITDGVTNPTEIAFDPSGSLYVSNKETLDKGNVTVYSAGAFRILRTVAGYKGVSYALTFSKRGALYVVSHYKYQCCDIKGSVAVYAPGGSRPNQRLSDVGSFPGRPAFDASGTLYVPNFNDFPGYVSLYKPGSKTPFRVISQGIGFPLQLAFDTRGRLYVLNGLFDGGTDVTVYAENGALARTIKAGVSHASAIALDARDDLYVANHGAKGIPASVTTYAPGSSEPVRSIQDGVRYPIALAFDTGGNLYVANSPLGINTVTVYAPGSDRPRQTYRLTETVTALAIP